MFQVVSKNKSHITISRRVTLTKTCDRAFINLIASDLVSGVLSSPQDVSTLVLTKPLFRVLFRSVVLARIYTNVYLRLLC